MDGDNNSDTYPAISDSRITSHVQSICSKSSRCIDTFVIYLNGPTTKNGDLVLWDWDKDKKAIDSEILTVEELVSSLRHCNAKNVLIIADQNYAGHLIDHVQRQRASGRKSFMKVHILTATDKGSYAWKRDFTQMFIKLDNDMIGNAGQVTKPNSRRISSIAEVSK